MEEEEKEDLDMMLAQLEEKKQIQVKEYNKAVRLHRMSMREIIFNIEELEEFTNKIVDPEVLRDLLQKCPIDLTIPLTIKLNTGAHLSDDNDIKFDSKKQSKSH